MAITKMWFIHWALPQRIREVLLLGWDNEMMWVAFSTFGKKMFLDQPCLLPNPPNFKPKVEVDPKYRFTEEDIKKFYEQGFLGPITAFSPEEMSKMRKDIEDVLLSDKRKSKVYSIGEGQTDVKETELISKDQLVQAINGRDRHLDCWEIWNLINQDPIKERLAQMLGPDLIVWRSQFFNKMPGAPAVVWHAASTYLSEALSEPVLRPKNINELFQITTWVAIDDADLENGCMHFVPGTHRRFLPAVFLQSSRDDMNGKFAGLAARPDYDGLNPFPLPEEDYKSGKVIPMPLKAGQCVMFFERTIHGSPPNMSTNRRRLGITFRTCIPSTKIYGSKKWHGVTYLNSKFDLEKWGALVLRGNPGTLNRINSPPQKPADKKY